jgi:hypothetical protein
MRFLLALFLFFTITSAAHAQVLGNPADALAELPIEYPVYDPATKCSKRERPGAVALAWWLEHNVRGDFWGIYRCEKWGKESASLHAEGRAVDWHLDNRVPADQRAAQRLFRLLLAPDRLGSPQALARRMGVQELIWDCGYWSAGMPEFRRYSACRRGVDRTTAHRDHVHIGMTKDGAMARTSFWTAR